ncbi:large pilS cassette protein [Neisseria gonorrhoeae]|uniref:large pilS cassette protein n=1 Tax=Neisseria gonorrhoeae TaxID=485 RepID=UPI001249935B|nr:large pilS cassette protein [Neisseria gonorrhoeae]
MTGFNDAAGNDKIDTKHLPSTCRDKSSAVCTKHHAPISNAFQETELLKIKIPHQPTVC